MTEKRYYQKNYDELYYIFDSKTLSEKEFEEKVEYDGYDVFADSLTSEEIIDLLNENERLKERVKQLQINNKVIKKIYKTFYKPIGINQEYITENEELKRENEELKQEIQGCKDDRLRFEEEARLDAIDNALDEENEQLKALITSMGFTIKKENGNIVKLTKEDRN